VRRLIILLLVLAVLAVGGLYALKHRSAIVGALPVPIRDTVRGLVHGFTVERNVMLTMPDGVRIASNIYKPRSGNGPFATILVRLPYNKSKYGEAVWIGEEFSTYGYVVVVQDVRGTFASEGVFTPSRLEAEDGSATMDWIAKQPWSNGRVGTFGCSSLGEAQMFMARMKNPHHRALIAQGNGGAMGTAFNRYTFFGLYEGGIFNLASGFGWFLSNGSKHAGHPRPEVDRARVLWELPSGTLVSRHRKDPTDYEDFISKPFSDAYWRDLGYISDEHRFTTPGLQVNAWQDQTVADTLLLGELMKRNADSPEARDHQHVVIGAGGHCGFETEQNDGKVGDFELGPNAPQNYWGWYHGWFDYWLRDKKDALPDLPPYLLYVMGEDRWVKANEWPPKAVEFRPWYLGGTAPANSVRGGGTLAPDAPAGEGTSDEFTYDPAKPVPTRGGPICCTDTPGDRPGPIEQREVEEREDVLVYTSEPLKEGLRILGPLRAELHVSSSALDTDFTAKLVDVFPDGRALNIQEGALRMRYRDSFTNPELLKPGEVYKVSVDMRAIGWYLPPGHRLRLQISSSNFPRLERNLNTGGYNHDETVGVVARNRVYRDSVRPSAVILPVLDKP
jgi:uncharacterized protein